MIWTVNKPRRWLFWQAGKLFHRLKSGTLLSMSTHLPPLQLCLMIWTELKSVRRVMFRERRRAELLWKQGFRFSNVGNIESVLVRVIQWARQTSETRIDISRFLWKWGRHIPPQQNLTLPHCAEAPSLTSQMSSCHDLSVCQPCQTPNSAHSTIAGKFQIFLTAPTSLSLSESLVEATASNFLGAHVGARVGVCVYFPYGCSRSPLNKTVVPLLSKPTSFVSNEHLPGSLPTTAGFSVSPCQQPMTLICCFITPKRCVCMCTCVRERGKVSEEEKYWENIAFSVGYTK